MKTEPVDKTLRDFYKNKIKNLQYIFGGDGNDDDGTIDREKVNVPPGG